MSATGRRKDGFFDDKITVIGAGMGGSLPQVFILVPEDKALEMKAHLDAIEGEDGARFETAIMRIEDIDSHSLLSKGSFEIHNSFYPVFLKTNVNVKNPPPITKKLLRLAFARHEDIDVLKDIFKDAEIKVRAVKEEEFIVDRAMYIRQTIELEKTLYSYFTKIAEVETGKAPSLN